MSDETAMAMNIRLTYLACELAAARAVVDAARAFVKGPIDRHAEAVALADAVKKYDADRVEEVPSLFGGAA